MRNALLFAAAASLVGVAGLAWAEPPAHDHDSHGAQATPAQPMKNCPQPMARSGERGAGMQGNGGHMSMDEHHRHDMKGDNHRMDGMEAKACEEMMKKDRHGSRGAAPAPAPSAAPKP